VGVTIDFRAVVSGGSAPYNLSWSFGDGSYGYGPSPTHAYAQAGTYSVKVDLADSAGVRVNETLSVVVSAASSPATSSGGSAPSTGVSLFLGILVGATVAVVGLYAIGRSKRRNPPPPHPYIPPEGSG
jgi:hypothetical protein